jgi:hypothetical protein
MKLYLNIPKLEKLAAKNIGKFIITFAQLESLGINLKEVLSLFSKKEFDVEYMQSKHCYLVVWNTDPKAVLFGSNQISYDHQFLLTKQEILELLNLNIELKYIL